MVFTTPAAAGGGEEMLYEQSTKDLIFVGAVLGTIVVVVALFAAVYHLLTARYEANYRLVMERLKPKPPPKPRAEEVKLLDSRETALDEVQGYSQIGQMMRS